MIQFFSTFLCRVSFGPLRNYLSENSRTFDLVHLSGLSVYPRFLVWKMNLSRKITQERLGWKNLYNILLNSLGGIRKNSWCAIESWIWSSENILHNTSVCTMYMVGMKNLYNILLNSLGWITKNPSLWTLWCAIVCFLRVPDSVSISSRYELIGHKFTALHCYPNVFKFWKQPFLGQN